MKTLAVFAVALGAIWAMDRDDSRSDWEPPCDVAAEMRKPLNDPGSSPGFSRDMKCIQSK